MQYFTHFPDKKKISSARIKQTMNSKIQIITIKRLETFCNYFRVWNKAVICYLKFKMVALHAAGEIASRTRPNSIRQVRSRLPRVTR